MKNILIVDTNFLINNIGNIQEIVKELNENKVNNMFTVESVDDLPF